MIHPIASNGSFHAHYLHWVSMLHLAWSFLINHCSPYSPPPQSPPSPPPPSPYPPAPCAPPIPPPIPIPPPKPTYPPWDFPLPFAPGSPRHVALCSFGTRIPSLILLLFLFGPGGLFASFSSLSAFSRSYCSLGFGAGSGACTGSMRKCTMFMNPVPLPILTSRDFCACFCKVWWLI